MTVQESENIASRSRKPQTGVTRPPSWELSREERWHLHVIGLHLKYELLNLKNPLRLSSYLGDRPVMMLDAVHMPLMVTSSRPLASTL